MQNGKNILGYLIGLAALGLTVFVISKTWRAGQK